MNALTSLLRLSVRMKILGTAAILMTGAAMLALMGYIQLSASNERTTLMYEDVFKGETYLSAMEQAHGGVQLTLHEMALSTDSSELPQLKTEMQTQRSAFDAALAAAYAADSDGKDQAQLADISVKWNAYTTLIDMKFMPLIDAGKSEEATASLEADITPPYNALDTSLGMAEQQKIDVAQKTQDASAAAGQQAVLMLLGVFFAAVLIGTIVSLMLARGIRNGIASVQSVLTSMTDNCAAFLENGLAAFANNDLTVEVHPVSHPIEKYGSDEIGKTAIVTNKMLTRLQSTIASYEKARAGLTTTVAEVRDAAEEVTRTSSELNSAATQSGNASAQIAQTINQVAAGAGEQAKASSDTSTATQELSAVIGQVGSGAADTARKVDAASSALTQMASAITSASTASDEVKTVAAGAASAADRGRSAVRDTVDEMERIKVTVESASVKVTELGAKSDQIGAIVETIDDIAEQTNLLALNAAIEAARAGEQGKGFAVVADEVRKLAERSSLATKEIAALIADVQSGTSEAVEAMHSGAAEVEHGSELASQAGASLDEITSAVEATKAAVGRITTAVEAMSDASAGVVSASDAIANIAAQTNEAAARMTESADTVSRSVQAIAAISQENSASAEEVSAATEEMSGQAEEVVASASTLADMAKHLDDLVARFRIESSAGYSATPVSPVTDITARQSRAA